MLIKNKFPSRLHEARRENGLTLDELAAIYNEKFDGGLNKGTLSRYENGKQTPLTATISNLSIILNVSVDYLLGSDVTDLIMEYGHSDLHTKLPIYHTPVSAGSGAWMGEGHEYEFARFDDAPAKTDFALKVRGDSMCPIYNDGDIVFVKTDVIVESGQVGIFIYNGEGYLKQLQGNKLVSINDSYETIVINEWDSFVSVGRVIGKAI